MACITCRLEPPAKPPCPIVRLSDDKGSVWVPAQQTFKICSSFLGSRTSVAAFERLCGARGGSLILKGADLRQLMALQAAQPHATRVSVLKLHLLVKRLTPRFRPEGKPLAKQLAALRDHATLVPWDQPHELWLVPQPLPDSFPEVTGIPPQRHVRLTLTVTAPHLLEVNPLKQQLTGFQSWLTSSIQLNRDGHALGSKSWDNVRSVVHHFLGFLHVHCSAARPTLIDMLQPSAHAKFFRHLLEKGASHYAPRTHAYVAAKVISYLQSLPQGQHDSLDKLKHWLRRAAAQIKASLPVRRKDMELMKSSGTWADAADLLAAIMRGKALAEQLGRQGSVTDEEARIIHDAALACCIFGFLPPPRLTCLRDCVVPDYSGPCLHRDCKDRAACHGNQLLSPTDLSDSMRFAFPHHKTAISKQRARPIKYELPLDLSDLLELYLRVARPVLISKARPHPYLFLSKSGSSLATKPGASKLTLTFQTWIAWNGCKSRAVSPSTCRHIFVVDRRSHAHLPGPSDDHAAIAMGHSAKQWDEGIYDVGTHTRAAQQAVDDMAAWRSSHVRANASASRQASQHQPASNTTAETNAAGPLALDEDEDEEDLYLSFSDEEPE